LLLATCESPRIISRHTKRNKKWALKKFGEFLPVPSDEDLTSFLSFFSVLQRRSFSHLGRLEVAWNPATMDHHLRGEMMISAFLYARVSSREQEQEGFSIPAQLKLLRDYAVRNGLIIQEEFIDVETAKVAGRKQFDRMVQSLSRNKHCRTVLVEKTDRLYRNFRDAVTLEDLDVEVHLVKEGQIISKDARSQAKLIHGMQLVLARNYVENLREEIRIGVSRLPMSEDSPKSSQEERSPGPVATTQESVAPKSVEVGQRAGSAFPVRAIIGKSTSK
jgi:hypothetical protein